MAERLTWILEGLLFLGLFLMFLADNRGLWQRPASQGTNDDSHREISSGK